MEEKDLLRTENDENQDLNATAGTSEEVQPTVNEETTEQPAEPAVATEEPAQAPAVEETAVEAPAAEVAEPQSAEAMMAEIETGNAETAETETEEENETPAESIEQIEAEYKDLNLDEAVEELHRIVADPDYNKIKQRVGVLRSKVIAMLKEIRKEQLEKFLAEGGDKNAFEPEKSDVENKFDNALHIFKNNKNKFLENIEAEKQRNLEAKNAIIEELRVLVETENIKQA